MQKEAENYCELCGSVIHGKGITVNYEGSTITICPACYSKIKSHAKIVENKKQNTVQSRQTKKTQTETIWEIVDDYPKIIKEARESHGMSTKELAQKLKVQENIVKRIETGKLKPTIQLAKDLERILSIKILVKIDESNDNNSNNINNYELTLGDIINIREGRK
ncbi:multiprotein bridging factor aMBF1 [Acidianus brierleyi]|uniref:TIGR00270 family protein n=1 Tax=Acidianus brierleyi TaxID=41673 RepID=A0A2U9IIY1_9CREN|nr:multiprotein bridging factor aMBF1 [Acidianus brierleyi]AWR95936.1 TIGR00270 family protein [Acidianus brierleyi]